MILQEESESEQETNEPVVAHQKPQKGARGTKELDASPAPDLVQSQSGASNYGCLSLLKKRRSGRNMLSLSLCFYG